MIDIVMSAFGVSYHVTDATVSTGDEVQISTTETGVSFKVVVPNSDGFFNVDQDAIIGNISNGNPLSLGTVTGSGNSTKYYEINPGTMAPPRIIRRTDLIF